MYNIDTTASCNVLFLLLIALGRKVMKSVVSVCPFVFILPFELVDFWRWFFACVWVITITRRGLKIKIIGQGQRLGCIYYIRLARTVTWSVWPRSSIETSLPDCVFTWKKQSCRAESSHSRLQYVPSLCRRFASRNIPVSAVRIKVGRVMYRTQPVTAGAIFVVRFVELRKSCACRTKLIDGEIYRNALPIRATHAVANGISTDCAQTWRVL